MRPSYHQSPRDIAVRLVTAVGVSLELLHQLHGLHARQWDLENATRDPAASADQVARAKAEIDASNARRHQLIDAIDTATSYPPPLRGARYYSETIGEMCDRLLILDLKVAALERRSPSIDSEETPTVQGIKQVCAHLSVAAAQLLGDIAAGQAAVPPRAGVKVYHVPAGDGAR